MEPVQERRATPVPKELSFSEQRLATGFLIALALYFLLQLVIRITHGGALELDEAELVFQSRQLALGYGSQPPLYAWLQWLVFDVTGVSHFGLSVLKNILQFALYASVFQLARLLLGTFPAVAIASSLVLLVPLGWDAAIDRTHSLLVTALAAAALWAYFALLQKPDTLRSALLGLLLGLGMQSKYNFVIFALGLAVASLLVREHRKVIWSKYAWIAVSVAALCLLPHAVWFIQHVDTATAETLNKMADNKRGASYAANVANGFKNLFVSVASFVTPLWIALIFAYRSRRAGTLQWHAPPARFFLWLYTAGLVCVVGLIVSGYLADLRSRWLQTLLFSVPLACVAIFPPQQQLVYRRLLKVAVAAGLVVLVGVALRPQIQSALGKDSRIALPYPELASQLRQRFPEVKVVAVHNRWVGGNVRLQMPHVRVLMLDELCGQVKSIEGRVLVLAEAGPGRATRQDLQTCPGFVVAERGQLSAQSNRRNGKPMLFDHALMKREPQ